MIVNNLHPIAVPIAPDKTNAPLIVDANGMLPLAISFMRLQLIPRRRSEYPQFGGSMQLEQFSQRDALDRAEASAVLIMKKLLGLFRGEALDHTRRILRDTLYVKRIRVDIRVEFFLVHMEAAVLG
jgi:hypothetical protein